MTRRVLRWAARVGALVAAFGLGRLVGETTPVERDRPHVEGLDLEGRPVWRPAAPCPTCGGTGFVDDEMVVGCPHHG